MNSMNRTKSWWTEVWSVGRGTNRLYCGIARTEEGFAVDVFRGDTCVDSRVVDSRTAAVKAAASLERRHARDVRSEEAARRAAQQPLTAH
jgi:hypothetical protein